MVAPDRSMSQNAVQTPSYLQIVGDRPTMSVHDIESIFIDDNRRNVWIFQDNEVWSFSVDSLTFSRWPNIDFKDVEVTGGYDTANSRFLFWSRGVGMVYAWSPEQASTVRIDSSYNHRTQFGHAWFIHPRSSDIYAFGGYGFWQWRGYTSRFDQQTRKWNVVRLQDAEHMPAARNISLSTFDSKREHFHIFGGSAGRRDAREDISLDHIRFSDYWVLDVQRNIWIKREIFGIDSQYDPNRSLLLTHDSIQRGVIDTVGEIAWYPVRIPEEPFNIHLMAFDLMRGFGARTPVDLGMLGVDSRIHWYYLDAAANRLVIFWTHSPIVYKDSQLRVSTLQLPSPDSTRTMLDLIKMHGSYELATTDREPTIWLWVLSLTLLFVAGAVWSYRRKTESRRLLASETPPKITFCLLGEPRVLAGDTPMNLGLTESELGLLFWLYWKGRVGQPFQITDDIESALWSDSPNIDYIRKQRNRTIQGLNARLNKLFSPWWSEREWVVGQSSVSDKRKREYALQLEGLVVHCDLDDTHIEAINPYELLISHNGYWVEEIRNEIGKTSIPTKNSA
jgi:hypothetical protein